MIFKLPFDEAAEALDKWVGGARRCRIPSFVKLQKSIVKHHTAIIASSRTASPMAGSNP